MRNLTKIVYFTAIFITLMTIVLILVNNEIGYIPHFLKLFVLYLVFIDGGLLFFIIYKEGMRGGNKD
ncbi:MAG: hypothetical protein ACJA2C_000652 [Marinoscillum sp.]|jgi:hypothetical protein